MINKGIKKTFLIMLFVLFCIGVPSFKILVNESSLLYDEKIFCEIEDDIEFENDTVIVILDKLLSKKNKVHLLDFLVKICLKKLLI